MKFGDTLKNLRDMIGITQKELGDYLGVSRATIAGYEAKNHQPDYEKLEKIANYFKVSIDYLLTGEDTLYIEQATYPMINEKVVDAAVMNVYRTLPVESKQDALRYLKLLQMKQKYAKKDV